MKWKSFDADIPSQEALDLLESYRSKIIASAGIDERDVEAVDAFIRSALSDYDAHKNSSLNHTIAIHVFRPHEFDNMHQNDESLKLFTNWLASVKFDWRNRSDDLKQVIQNNWPTAGSTRLTGGREYVELDGLIMVGQKRVAFEVEASNNLDNGYFTLRQANRARVSDYGLMIVPWSSKGGRANEGRSLGRLDREFDSATHLTDGPIYRLAVMRNLDALRLSLMGSKSKNFGVD